MVESKKKDWERKSKSWIERLHAEGQSGEQGGAVHIPRMGRESKGAVRHVRDVYSWMVLIQFIPVLEYSLFHNVQERSHVET